MSTLEPDRDQIEIFIDALFRHAGDRGFVSLRAFYENDTKKPFRITPVALKGTGNFRFLVECAEDDSRRAAQFPQPIVFCPPLATFAVKDRAREQDILLGLTLSVECDQHPEEARQKLQEVLGEATAIVRSGGQWVNGGGEAEDKLHLHWRLREPATGEGLKKLKHARDLAARLVGGDPSNKTVCHPIRWPGSWHRKSTPRLCEIVSHNADTEINLDDALAALKAAAKDKPEPEPKDDSPRRDWNKDFGDIITGKSFNPTLTPLAASFAAHGVPELVANKALSALLANTQTTDSARLARRDTELSKLRETVRSGYAKFTPPAELFDPWLPFIVPEFPHDVLPPVVHEFVLNQSLAIGVDRSAMAMAALAAISGAIHHRWCIKMKRLSDWWEHARLWVLLVGKPAWKKTPAVNAATRPNERRQAERVRNYRAALRDYELKKKDGDKDAEKPDPPERYVVGDTTSEMLSEILSRSDRGTLGKYDEVAGWIGRMDRYQSSAKGASSDRSFWLQAWNGGPYTYDRKTSGETYIHNLSVSILAGVQPERLKEIRGLTSDGLLQRFLTVLMRPPKPAVDLDCSQSNADYERLAYRLFTYAPQRLTLTDAAADAMQALQAHIYNIEQVGDVFGEGFEGFVGKLPAYAGALSIIMHVIADPDNVRSSVAKPIVESTCRIIQDFLIPHAVEFYSQGEGVADRTRRIASYILTCGRDRVRLTDLTSNVRDCRGLDVLTVNQWVSPLVAGGWLSPIDLGPACRAWDVNRTDIDTKFAERTKTEEARKAEIVRLIKEAQDK
jgi:hypothetical protein